MTSSDIHPMWKDNGDGRVPGSRDFTDAPLIVATSREPYRLRRTNNGESRLEQTTGGLVSALVPAVANSGGLWVAWNPGSRLSVGDFEGRLDHELSLVPVTDTEVDGYYRGLANGALWPLCHYAIDRCCFRESDWNHYVAVNRKFADRIAARARPSSLAWIHDYHLMLVPGLLRQARQFAGRIGYFHHIPFAAPEVFRVLPWWRDVVQGVLGADLVGFHTADYVDNFLDMCRSLSDAEVCMTTRTVLYQGRIVEVRAFPIGIDSRCFEDLATDERIRSQSLRIRSSLGVETVLIGADRLDYTKGIEQRFDALDHLLSTRPELCGKISMLQIAVPCRSGVPEYGRFKQGLDETVGRINGKYARDGWQPIHCVYRNHSRADLVAHYLAADIALVTPLRDGMNLVAQEFCASRVDNDGVLILSEFAGSSVTLGGDALIINPFDTEGFARTIAQAMSLEQSDRQSRMHRLRRAVNAQCIYGWTRDFLGQAHGQRLETSRSA